MFLFTSSSWWPSPAATPCGYSHDADQKLAYSSTRQLFACWNDIIIIIIIKELSTNDDGPNDVLWAWASSTESVDTRILLVVCCCGWCSLRIKSSTRTCPVVWSGGGSSSYYLDLFKCTGIMGRTSLHYKFPQFAILASQWLLCWLWPGSMMQVSLTGDRVCSQQKHRSRRASFAFAGWW